MKKIGIMTFHASHNNGSMLQALALQHVLETKYSLPVEIVNYSNMAQRNMYAPLPKATNWKKFIKKIIWATNYRQMYKQYEAYQNFSKKYFHLSDLSYCSSEEIAKCLPSYCAMIVGSDQIWNIKCVDADDAYFLNFLKGVPKYAYAVSFGANNPFELEGEKGHYENLIGDFSKISVREWNAQKWILEATNDLVPVCLDPTLLLGREEWEKIVYIGEKPIIQGEYIFYYCFSIDNKTQRFLNYVSNAYQMPIYFMDAKEWTLKMCWRNNINLIKEYGPDVYLNVLKYSKIFLTTSFHGMAFATIFEKCFWYIDDEKKDGKDDRALTLLTQLGLLDRYKTISELKQMDLLLSKDFSEVKNRLIELRKNSYAFLDEVVKEIKNE